MAEKDKTFIDPRFYRPKEVTDFTSKRPDESDTPVDVGPNNGLNPLVGGIIPYTPPPVIDVLPVLTEITSFEQVIKHMPNGTVFVDVVINVPELQGIVGYNIRVTSS